MKRSVVLALVACALSACATVTSLASDPAGELVYPGAVLTNQHETFGDTHEFNRTYSVPAGTTVQDVFSWYEAQLPALEFHPGKVPTMYAKGEVAQVFNGRRATVDVGVKLEPADHGIWGTAHAGQAAPAKVLRLQPSQIMVSISGG